MNQDIKSSRLRVVSQNGEQLGILETREALNMARDQGLDLIVVSGKSDPPVAKIQDYGKLLYEQKKKEKAAKANRTVIVTKEIQLRPVTDSGDMERKINDAKRFLEKNNKVKFIMKFRGRERSHYQRGMEIMNEILHQLGDEIVMETKPTMNGNNITMIVS